MFDDSMDTHLVSARDAAFAITVLPRFCMAVITSVSVCVAGGIRRHSLSSLSDGGLHAGICNMFVSRTYLSAPLVHSPIRISLHQLVYIIQLAHRGVRVLLPSDSHLGFRRLGKSKR